MAQVYSARWNDASNHSKRRRIFNVPEFKRLAAAAVNQNAEDVRSLGKLAEGGFNRTFLITMRDGFQFVGRVPYPMTAPRNLVVASEVATMDFLRLHGIPVPHIYSYSTTSQNTAGTEYIFMDLVRGTKLGDIWFDLSEKARITVITSLVELESKLFALRFPASGSLYHIKDLQSASSRVEVPLPDSTPNSDFCIGPDTRLSLWYGKRADIEIDRGPFTDPAAVLTAGAKKEIAYLAKFGRPLHPFQRLRRDIYDYKKRLPSDHCSIPNSLQNYRDDICESPLTTPTLPPNFEELSEKEQFEQVELLRRRQLHYFYVAMTAKLNPIHYDALAYDYSILRRKLFDYSSCPWQGDNVTLKADLIYLVKNWSNIAAQESSTKDDAKALCPISFTEDEVLECERLNDSQIEADKLLQAYRDFVGIGVDGWVPLEEYESTKQREINLKACALEAAESEEERAILSEHWISDDFDEAEYS
ncbi:phosphotransferase family protein [Periconia macrospinosa]|uniref:Phosphotransferase family protein n=1 Tax=Periconia macrospinosa TaxID=97972 RepID=A0A2V1DYC8_9PLEO|nr:phosphotransferase family protein [Periconia macrospinosa]